MSMSEKDRWKVNLFSWTLINPKIRYPNISLIINIEISKFIIITDYMFSRLQQTEWAV